MSRHFVTVSETSHEDLDEILAGALRPVPTTELEGIRVSLVFERPSLRTRASSIASVQDLGGQVAVFTDAEIGIDTRESAEDIARTLAETSSIVAARVKNHDVFARMQLATGDRVSYINLLSNYAHPAQAVADTLTLAEVFGGSLGELAGRTVTYVGDATNVTRSLATILVGFGVNVRVAAPEGYDLSTADVALIESRARYGGSLSVGDDAAALVRGADAVYTDSWISMGLEDEAAERRHVFAPYQVNADLMSHAPDAFILHCLPAHRGEEITDEVLDSPRSLIWREVHHRTTAMYGILRWIKGA